MNRMSAEEMSERILVARRVVREILGDRYEMIVAPIRAELLANAQLMGEPGNFLGAALVALKRNAFEAAFQLKILAAVADLSDHATVVKRPAPVPTEPPQE